MVPAGLVALLGLIFDEPRLPDFSYKQVTRALEAVDIAAISIVSLAFLDVWSIQVGRQFKEAGKAMFTRLSRPAVWRPCVYMYVSFALSLDISDGMFYWYTDAKNGPSFSQVCGRAQL